MRNKKLFCGLLAVFAALVAVCQPIKSRLASAETDYLSPLPPLPYDAIPVEYIETDGNQWIDTGLPMDEGVTCFARHQFSLSKSGKRQLMGSNASRQYYGVSADGYIEFGAINVGKTTVAVKEDTIYSIFYSALNGSNTCKVFDEEGRELYSKSGEYYSFINTFQIFHMHNWSAAYPFDSGNRIYFFAFMDVASEEYLIKLIPVRFPNEFGEWEGAMYDFVSGELFRNQGTGSFVIGPDL